jgi:hypothetical protein
LTLLLYITTRQKYASHYQYFLIKMNIFVNHKMPMKMNSQKKALFSTFFRCESSYLVIIILIFWFCRKSLICLLQLFLDFLHCRWWTKHIQ